MSESRRQLLSIGVFFIITVVALTLYAAKVLMNWLNIFPLILVLFGIWLILLSGIKSQKTFKYERDPFSTLGMGLLLMALGGAWLLFMINVLYSLILILLVLGVITVVAALRRKKP